MAGQSRAGMGWNSSIFLVPKLRTEGYGKANAEDLAFQTKAPWGWPQLWEPGGPESEGTNAG